MSRSKDEKALSKRVLANVRHCDTTWAYSRWKREARMGSDSAYRTFVLQQYKLNFGEDAPQGVHVELLDAKNMYHVEGEEKKKNGIEPSPKWLKNYKAAMKLDLQGFDADLKTLLEIGIKHRSTDPEKEQEMKMKRKAAAEKAQNTKAERTPNKGPKKGATWYELFKANHTKKLTDSELAEAMTKAMNDGHVYTEQEVVKNRGFYNFGGFGKNYPKPSKALEQFKDEKPAKAEKKQVKK